MREKYGRKNGSCCLRTYRNALEPICDQHQHKHRTNSTMLEEEKTNCLYMENLTTFANEHRRQGVSEAKKQEKEQIRVICLIGDKERNLEQIARAIECGDNCKQEFMKVVGIMMDKIYKLREEKNFYKGECERLRAWSGLGGQSVFSKEKQYAAVCNRKMAEQSLKTSKQKGRAKTKQVDQRVEKPLEEKFVNEDFIVLTEPFEKYFMMEGNEVDQHSEIDTRNETNLLSDLSNSHYAKESTTTNLPLKNSVSNSKVNEKQVKRRQKSSYCQEESKENIFGKSTGKPSNENSKRAVRVKENSNCTIEGLSDYIERMDCIKQVRTQCTNNRKSVFF